MYKEIHLDAPNVGALEKRYISEAIDSGFISSVGPAVGEFEKRCADYLHTKKTVSTNSGTSALHIVLYELGIGNGDEVIVPALTFVATINPILYMGATPVLVDVNRETWNMEPELVEKAITKKTKAIIPVHLYGNPCDMNEINRIAKKYNLFIVEDAAESLGAQYGGISTGNLGDLGCLSFNGNKTITTGGGGMVCGNNLGRLEHIHFLVNQARAKNPGMIHTEVGFNYRMTNLQASMGLAQIERLQGFLEKKRGFNALYKQQLGDQKNIRFQEEYESAESSHWFTCILTKDAVMRRDLQDHLQERGIPTRRIFTPLNEFPPYRELKFVDYGNARSIYERGICLPSSTLNESSSIRAVCTEVNEFCNESIFVC